MNALPTGTVLELDATHDPVREAARALLGKGNHLQRNEEHGVLELRAGTTPRPSIAAPRVILEAPGRSVSIVLDQDRGDSALGDLRWQDYEGDARLLAWSLAHEHLVASLSRLFGGALLPTAFQPHMPNEQLWLELSWRDASDAQQQGWLGLSREAIDTLAQAPEWKRDPRRIATVGEVDKVTLHLIVAGRLLDAGAIATLAIGDVLVVGATADCEGRLQPERASSRDVFGLPDGWTVRWQQGQWLIGANAALNSNIEPNRPQFLLTSLAISLEEVSVLQAGSVAIRDAALIGSTVGIVLHGHRFGEGVLVGMGAWLGVRITHKEGDHGSR
jgi:type III secretion protein Q